MQHAQLDVLRGEEVSAVSDSQHGYDREKELEQYKKAVEMCIVGDFLKREKFNEALAFVQKFHA